MEEIKNAFRNNVRQYAMIIALVVIMAYFQVVTNGILLVPMNVTNLILQNSYVLILAIGMTITILTGGNIDLSVGSLCAFIGAITGVLIYDKGMNVSLAIIIVLIVGVLAGIWQGFWIAFVRIPSFIVTLAGMLLFRGLTVTILQGQTKSPFPESFQRISGGFVPDFLNVFDINLNITTLIVAAILSIIYIFVEIKKRKERIKYQLETSSLSIFVGKLVVIIGAIMLFAFWLARYKGMPIILVIIGTLIFVYTFITTKTVQGRYLYATGGNEKAAKLSGINTNKVLFYAYTNMALLSAVAGVAFTSRLNAASPQAGVNFELDAIAACFIGGASAYGGVGTVIGAIIGALVMGVLNNGMSIMGVGSDWQMSIKGIVLLAAVAFDVFSKRKTK